MDDRIHLQIVTPSAIAVDEMVGYVRLPLEGGSIGVLHGHAPLIGAVEAGVVKYTRQGVDRFAAVGRGVVKVTGDEVALLALHAECCDSAAAARDAARQIRSENK